jgi:hypothetical protein
MASLRLPLSQHASNVDLGIVGIVWLEILELLAEGCMLCSREGRWPFSQSASGLLAARNIQCLMKSAW